MHVFSLTCGLTRSWRDEDAQCCQLINIADPFSDFFPFKKAPKPYLVSENRRFSLSLSLSLSLSPSLSASAQVLFSARQRRAELNSVKHRYYVACFSNFTCKYSRKHSTAIVFILCVFDFIRRQLDYQDFCAD